MNFSFSTVHLKGGHVVGSPGRVYKAKIEDEVEWGVAGCTEVISTTESIAYSLCSSAPAPAASASTGAAAAGAEVLATFSALMMSASEDTGFSTPAHGRGGGASTLNHDTRELRGGDTFAGRDAHGCGAVRVCGGLCDGQGCAEGTTVRRVGL